MKAKILMTLALMVAMISGCGKESGRGGESMDGAQTVTFNLSIDPSISTRADGAPGRYVVQAWSMMGSHLESHVESSEPAISVKLTPNERYTFRCWADYGTPNATPGVNDYDVTDLKAAKVAEGKTPSKPAYYGKAAVLVTNGTIQNIQLKHAVAMVNFVKKDNFVDANNKLKVTFKSVYSFDVDWPTGSTPLYESSGNSNTAQYEFSNIGQNVAGQTIATSYIIAKLDEQSSPDATIIDMDIDLNDGDVTSLTNVPFNMNKRTNIKGSFSNQYSLPVDITSDGEWSTDINFPSNPKVGDFCYSDGTYSTELNINKTCKGIVFWVNPDDKTKGKAISVVNAGNGTAWDRSSSPTFIGATSETDGRANQDLAALAGSLYLYDAMNWCELYVPSQDWYLPAIKELTEQLAPVFTMVNEKINLVSGGVVINGEFMWSSTEVDAANVMVAKSFTTTGTASNGNMTKNSFPALIETRAVRSF